MLVVRLCLLASELFVRLDRLRFRTRLGPIYDHIYPFIHLTFRLLLLKLCKGSYSSLLLTFLQFKYLNPPLLLSESHYVLNPLGEATDGTSKRTDISSRI